MLQMLQGPPGAPGPSGAPGAPGPQTSPHAQAPPRRAPSGPKAKTPMRAFFGKTARNRVLPGPISSAGRPHDASPSISAPLRARSTHGRNTHGERRMHELCHRPPKSIPLLPAKRILVQFRAIYPSLGATTAPADSSPAITALANPGPATTAPARTPRPGREKGRREADPCLAVCGAKARGCRTKARTKTPGPPVGRRPRPCG